jgi:hypothetical protein
LAFVDPGDLLERFVIYLVRRSSSFKAFDE